VTSKQPRKNCRRVKPGNTGGARKPLEAEFQKRFGWGKEVQGDFINAEENPHVLPKKRGCSKKSEKNATEKAKDERDKPVWMRKRGHQYRIPQTHWHAKKKNDKCKGGPKKK